MRISEGSNSGFIFVTGEKKLNLDETRIDERLVPLEERFTFDFVPAPLRRPVKTKS